MRTYGAEKLPWLVIEVEVDAERAGCFAERQLRLGLVVERATPETRDASGTPVERTKERSRRTGELAQSTRTWVALALRKSSATLT